MRTCQSCRRDNADEARFCISCGSPLAGPCSRCGADLPPEADFCPSCGAPVALASVADEERKIVTVLFADLVDSTASADRLDPEDVRGLLSPYFARVRAEVERFGGVVEKFIGDAVMAVFGAPLAHGDDPERAVRAAFAVRDAVAEMNERPEVVELHVRVAVNTGEAMVTLDPAVREGEGMVTGDVVNTASRLQNAAPVDGILVGEATYRATAGAIVYRHVAPVKAKGKPEPVPVWQAVQPRDGDVSPSSPLVGRWRELGQLLDAVLRVRQARTPQLVSLVGVSGIGKTRLARELVSAVEAEPGFAAWLSGRCLPYGDGVSFAAVAEMARSAAGILTTDSPEEAAEKLRSSLEQLPGDANPDWLETHLAPLVGLAGEPSRIEEASFAAWRRFFEALAERSPLLLVFEDLHWADPAVLDFVDHLVDWATSVPLLVLCTARPELLARRPGWGGGKRNAITISLSPLSDEETGELLQALLAQKELPAGAAGPVLTHIGGNPLYAEEYARMLVERGFLVGENGVWQLATPQLPLPESVQGTIAARVDGLPADEKAILQQAAVVGKVFWLGAVAVGAGVARPQAERLLHTLERKEFVRRERRSSIADEVEYAFRHVLVRDVAYNQLPRARRAEAHERAAAWLEGLAGAGGEKAELVAHHYGMALRLARAAGLPTTDLVKRAREALRDAGDRALRLNAFAAADRFYAAALELCANDDPMRPRLLFSYGKARLRAKYTGLEILGEARDGLLASGDRERAAEAEVMMGELLWMQGQHEDSFGHVERAAGLLEDAPPSRSKAYVLSSLSRFLMSSDENEEAVRVGLEALEMAEALGLDELRAHALNNIGVARVDIGDRSGLRDLQRSLAISVDISSPESVRGYLNLGSSFAELGDLRRAFELYDLGRRAAERFGDAGGLRWFAQERIYENYWTGRWDGAVELAEQLFRELEAHERHWMELDASLGRGWIRLARGDVAGAVSDSERALGFARRADNPQALFPALAFHARALLASGSAVEADAPATELLTQWEKHGATLASFWTADLAVVLGALRRGDELIDVAANVKMATRWLEAAQAVARDEFGRAAVIYAKIGSRPDEAFARLREAERLLGDDREREAAAQLERARAFHGEVDADLYLREEGAMAAGSA
jgi:class 3 adenylate cyclase/tetratricopeptide (TPR) repeat protein